MAKRNELSLQENKIEMSQVDLFATRLTTHVQCSCYFSWRLDPYAQATDAFLQDCLTIDLIYEPTGYMDHFGPEWMQSIYQECTVYSNQAS